MQVELILNANATIGESPTWVASQNRLYWIDVKEPALHCFDVDSPLTSAQRWEMPADIGAFALLPAMDGAVVALRDGIYKFMFSTQALTQLAPAPFDPARFRFNEGACDKAGRFWVGAMFDPADPDLPAEKASLHCFTLANGLAAQPDAAELYNGMAWSPEETFFYLSHSQTREIHRFNYEASSGALSKGKIFARIDSEDGVPDGAAVDVEGGYWCALHGAGKIRRYFPDGSVDRDISLPVSQPTMCAFGGPHLSDLYITSANDQLTPEQRTREPLAGAILRIRTDMAGVQRYHTAS